MGNFVGKYGFFAGITQRTERIDPNYWLQLRNTIHSKNPFQLVFFHIGDNEILLFIC